MNYGHPTTEVFSRTARKSGTEYANAYEGKRRRDTSGRMIVFIGCALVVAGAYLLAWGSI